MMGLGVYDGYIFEGQLVEAFNTTSSEGHT